MTGVDIAKLAWRILWRLGYQGGSRKELLDQQGQTHGRDNNVGAIEKELLDQQGQTHGRDNNVGAIEKQ